MEKMSLKRKLTLAGVAILVLALGWFAFCNKARAAEPSPFVMATLVGPSQNVEFGLNATLNFPTSPKGPIVGFGVAMTRLDSRSGSVAPDWYDLRGSWTPQPIDFRLPAETEYTAVFTIGFPLDFGGGSHKK